MTRTVSATGYDQQKTEFAYLYELAYSGGTLYLTNASFDITYDGHDWLSVGNIVHGPVSEGGGSKAANISLELFGVDQTIISTIMSNQFRGYLARIYLVHFNETTGAIAGTPYQIWQGKQLGDYDIEEDRDSGSESGGLVRVTAVLASSLSAIRQVYSIRANPTSHQQLLRRGGLSTTDDFFSRVQSLMGKEVIWGTDTPASDVVGRPDNEGWYRGPGDE